MQLKQSVDWQTVNMFLFVVIILELILTFLWLCLDDIILVNVRAGWFSLSCLICLLFFVDLIFNKACMNFLQMSTICLTVVECHLVQLSASWTVAAKREFNVFILL